MSVPVVAGVTKGGISDSGGSFTVSLPGGATDYLAFISWYGSASDYTAPSGWTVYNSGFNVLDTQWSRWAVLTATGTPGTSWTHVNSSEDMSVIVIGFTAPVTIENFDITYSNADTQSPITGGSVTTSVATIDIVACFGDEWNFTGSALIVYPSGWADNRTQQVPSATATDQMMVAIATKDMPTPGSSGAPVWQGNSTGSGAANLYDSPLVNIALSTPGGAVAATWTPQTRPRLPGPPRGPFRGLPAPIWTGGVASGGQTATVSFDSTSTMGVTAAVTELAAITIAGASTMAAVAAVTESAAVVFASTSAMAVTAVDQIPATVGFGSTSGMGVAAAVTELAAVTMAGTSTMAAAGTQTDSSTVTIAGSSAMGVAAAITKPATVTMAQTSSMAVAGQQTIPAAVAFGQSSTVTVAVQGQQQAAVTMAQASTLAAAAAIAHAAAVAMAQASAMATVAAVTDVATVGFGSSSSLTVAGAQILLAALIMAQASTMGVVGQVGSPTLHTLSGRFGPPRLAGQFGDQRLVGAFGRPRLSGRFDV